MKPDAIVCHPGPINRGVELDSYMADHPERSVILDQVYAGILTRMAALYLLLEGATMALLLKNAHVIDPQVGLNEVCEILIRDGKIVEVGHDLTMEKGVERDLGGKIVVPASSTSTCICASPASEQKEDIASGTRAAALGGFTAGLLHAQHQPRHRQRARRRVRQLPALARSASAACTSRAPAARALRARRSRRWAT